MDGVNHPQMLCVLGLPHYIYIHLVIKRGLLERTVFIQWEFQDPKLEVLLYRPGYVSKYRVQPGKFD